VFKKSITYTNFDNKEVTKDFYFNLSAAELVEMDVQNDGGLQKKLQTIMGTQDGGIILNEFKDIVKAAVGERSVDGEDFIKSEDISNRFIRSGAFDELLLEFLSNADAAATFVKGILPARLMEEMEKQGKIPAIELDPRDPAFLAMQAAQTQVPGSMPPPPPPNEGRVIGGN